MSVTLNVTAAGRTHVGLVRRRNEDRMHIGQALFAVADGLGGHIAGDVASATVIEALRPYDTLVAPADLARSLAQAVQAANTALRRRIAAEPELAGMGTTLVAMLWSGTYAALANVGDSRAYLLRRTEGEPNLTVQITEDHTYGHLLAEAATVPNLPDRLSRFLDGRADGRSADMTVWASRPGDRLLLCSDGLSSYVPHQLVHAALAAPGPAEKAANQLVQHALDHGGPDNVTVIVIDTAA
jgi:protein phosphatase